MSLFLSAAETAATNTIDDLSYDKSSNLCLDNRAEILRCQQAPGSAIQYENRICLTGDWLNTVELSFYIVVLSLITVVTRQIPF